MTECGNLSDVTIPLINAFLKSIKEGFIYLAFKVLFSHLFSLLFAFLILSFDLMIDDELYLRYVKILKALDKLNLKLSETLLNDI